ncbi:MAG: hypothetical protein ABGY15_07430 [bacterium]|nr:hypothetical protein [Planctomycetota bacterium]
MIERIWPSSNRRAWIEGIHHLARSSTVPEGPLRINPGFPQESHGEGRNDKNWPKLAHIPSIAACSGVVRETATVGRFVTSPEDHHHGGRLIAGSIARQGVRITRNPNNE